MGWPEVPLKGCRQLIRAVGPTPHKIRINKFYLETTEDEREEAGMIFRFLIWGTTN